MDRLLGLECDQLWVTEMLHLQTCVVIGSKFEDRVYNLFIQLLNMALVHLPCDGVDYLIVNVKWEGMTI